MLPEAVAETFNGIDRLVSEGEAGDGVAVGIGDRCDQVLRNTLGDHAAGAAVEAEGDFGRRANGEVACGGS